MKKQKHAESAASELDFFRPAAVAQRRSEQSSLAADSQPFRSPTPWDMESQVEWLFDCALFPLVRQSWELFLRRSPVQAKSHHGDGRLIVGGTTVGTNWTSDDGWHRRTFFLLPKDLVVLQAYLSGDGGKCILPSSTDWVPPSTVRVGTQTGPLDGAGYENLSEEQRTQLDRILQSHVEKLPQSLRRKMNR